MGGGGSKYKKGRVNQVRIQEFISKGRPVWARGLGSRATPSRGPRRGSSPKAAGNYE